ncbi:superoxide dismutase [Cu-Zn]-like [Pollicipes pollicipes]|uniref:superoxide dismutase [Cu-Zn]-like n=1 Tax=Pollicipes pollicipes TaxID=41117 RepID=UPI001884BB4E|nr:superoxide dismutase [Cu-Zn]-like [Pollicipes pollicipes]
MVDIKLTVSVAAALLVGAVVGGLVGHFAVPSSDPNVPKAVPADAQCILQGAVANSNVRGTISFRRSGGTITVTGTVTGLSPGKHGFHVHQAGSTANGCKAAKGHFNPLGKAHGAPSSAERHVGDLGNIVADANQLANINIKDSVIRFAGDGNILGRAIVIHAGEDDLGLGGQSDSKTTGHAGARLACCIIGAVN